MPNSRFINRTATPDGRTPVLRSSARVSRRKAPPVLCHLNIVFQGYST
ncbi:hypothetical protein DDI_1669 [Dickeya dianthicola RNS04.9]|nr:hypothetical protein DDI_1669 [Dickeya dianthicola RNS04.9]